MKLAIIGHGFVGKAVDYGFKKKNIEKIIIDPRLNTSLEDLKGEKIDATFICVPTPMSEDGSIDSSILEKCVSFLKENVTGHIIIKSTVTPNILKKIVYGPSANRIVYNPEFLTEKCANEDFVNPIMHVFGGNIETTKEVEEFYKKYSSCKPCEVFHMTIEEASFVKYGINSFLATKVLWFNQFFDIIEKSGSNYDVIVNAITCDKRIGPSHTSVPGFDGRRGYGSACFSKDIPAFIKFSQEIGKDFTVLKESWNKNYEYRSQYDSLLEREKEQNIKFFKM